VARLGAGACGLLSAFTLLTLVLACSQHGPFGWDTALTETVTAARTPAATKVAVLLHRVGAWPWGALPLTGVLLLPLLRRQWSAAILVVSAWAATSLVAVPAVKWLLDRSRPVDPLVWEDTASYPSGHTAFAAVLAVAASAVCPPRARLPTALCGTVVVAAMAWSRIYLGAHWLTDTVGGALLGSGIGLLCCGLGYLLRQRFRVRPE
jgi:membrane-associated phospholipid phosphatase